MMQATQSYALAVPLGGAAAQRGSGGVKTGGLDVKLLWPCKDGFASVTFLFGASIGPFTKRLMQWIYEEGYCDEATRDKDWLDYANLLYSGARADRGVRPPEARRRRLLRRQDEGRAARGGVRADAADRPGRHARRRAAQRRSSRPATTSTRSPTTCCRRRPVRAPGSLGAPVRRRADVRLGRAPRLGEHTAEVLGASRRARPRAAGAERRAATAGRSTASRCST